MAVYEVEAEGCRENQYDKDLQTVADVVVKPAVLMIRNVMKR